MKRDLVILIDLMRIDLSQAAAAVERGDLDLAIAKFGKIAARASQKAEELRA